jgi:hypothetical protein
LRRIAATLSRAGATEPVQTLTPDQAGLIVAESVARYAVQRYPEPQYRAVVIGSPHGAAVHLAAALRVPWLPAGFDVTVRLPEGSPGGTPDLLGTGAELAGPILAANPELLVRQVHEPGAEYQGAEPDPVTLVLRWRLLPRAYDEFLAGRLAPGGPVLLVRDTGAVPALAGPGRYSFQYGSVPHQHGVPHQPPPDLLVGRMPGPGGGWPRTRNRWLTSPTGYAVTPGFAESLRISSAAGRHPLRLIRYADGAALSGAVADLYRRWLRRSGKTGDRLVIECGRQLDPWQVLRAGLVPYWLPGPGQHAVREACWWVAGSEPFSQIEVLIEPPGTAAPGLASLAQFEAVTRFATRQGRVDRAAARAYPFGVIPPRHATEVLRQHPYDLPIAAELPTTVAVSWLASRDGTGNLTVC